MPLHNKFRNFFEFLKDPQKVQLQIKPDYKVNKGGASFQEKILDDISDDKFSQKSTDLINSKTVKKNSTYNILQPLSNIIQKQVSHFQPFPLDQDSSHLFLNEELISLNKPSQQEHEYQREFYNQDSDESSGELNDFKKPIQSKYITRKYYLKQKREWSIFQATKYQKYIKLEKKLEECESLSKTLQRQLYDSRKSYDELYDRNLKLIYEKAAESKKFTDASEKKRQKYQELEQYKEALKLDYDDEIKKAEKQKKEIEELQESLSQMEKVLEANQNLKEHYENMKAELIVPFNALKRENAQLKMQVSNLERDCSLKCSEYVNSQSLIKLLREQINSQCNGVLRLTQENDKYRLEKSTILIQRDIAWERLDCVLQDKATEDQRSIWAQRLSNKQNMKREPLRKANEFVEMKRQLGLLKKQLEIEQNQWKKKEQDFNDQIEKSEQKKNLLQSEITGLQLQVQMSNIAMAQFNSKQNQIKYSSCKRCGAEDPFCLDSLL